MKPFIIIVAISLFLSNAFAAPCQGAAGAYHINKGGEVGGFVAYTASAGKNVFIGKDAQICDSARVYDYAQISGSAIIRENAQVYNEARVYGEAIVSGSAQIYGKAGVWEIARVYGFAHIYGFAGLRGYVQVYGVARMFDATYSSGRYY